MNGTVYKIENLFVGEYLYPDASELNEYFRNNIFPDNDKATSSSKVYCKMTTEKNLHTKHPKINSLANFVIDKLKSDFFPSDPNNLFCKYSWGLSYRSDDHINPHNHRGIYSFVYYVDVDGGSSPFIFCATEHKIYPQSGQVIIFDSELYHEVPKNKSKLRTCISGTIFNKLK